MNPDQVHDLTVSAALQKNRLTKNRGDHFNPSSDPR